jgi:hypothetical protein
MLEELRDHDPNPNETECAWMQADPLRVAVRVIALVALAIGIGATLSELGAVHSPAVVARAR